MKIDVEWRPKALDVARAMWSMSSDDQAEVFVWMAKFQRDVRDEDERRGFVVGIPVNQFWEIGRSAQRCADPDGVRHAFENMLGGSEP